jgi:hypothetical protein
MHWLFVNHVPKIEVVDPHLRLMAEHNAKLCIIMRRSLLMSDSSNISLKLDRADAVAFLQYWEQRDLPSEYFAGIMRRCIGEIDQFLKRPVLAIEAL